MMIPQMYCKVGMGHWESRLLSFKKILSLSLYPPPSLPLFLFLSLTLSFSLSLSLSLSLFLSLWHTHIQKFSPTHSKTHLQRDRYLHSWFFSISLVEIRRGKRLLQTITLVKSSIATNVKKIQTFFLQESENELRLICLFS